MEKLSSETVEMQCNVHEFYCDECGAFLGKSPEYDGTIPIKEYGGFSHTINCVLDYDYKDDLIGEGLCRNLSLHKQLCPTCAGDHLSKVIETLESLGYKVNKSK